MIWIALSLPLLVLAIVLLASLEGLLSRFAGKGIMPWMRGNRRHSLSRTSLEQFTLTVNGDAQTVLDQGDHEMMMRDEEDDGAPPTVNPAKAIDLESGVARIRLPSKNDS
jgi:hypothetical protein